MITFNDLHYNELLLSIVFIKNFFRDIEYLKSKKISIEIELYYRYIEY